MMRMPTRARLWVLCWGAALTALACERPTAPMSDVLTLEAAWTAPATLYAPYAFVEAVPRVRVLDQLGRPVAGVRVTFLALRAPDFPFVREVRSDAAGYAELDTLWQVGRRAGTQTIASYLVTGQTGEPLEFSVTVRPAPAQRIDIFRDSTTNIPVGDTAQVRGTYRDVYGNAVTSDAPISFFAGTPAVLSVDVGGRAVGLAAGQAWVVAQGGGLRDSTRMAVGPSLTLLRNDVPGISGAVTPQGLVFASNGAPSDQLVPLAGGPRVQLSNGAGFSSFAYSASESVLWRVGQGYVGLRALNPISGATLRAVGSGGPYRQIALIPDGSEAFVTDVSNTLYRISTVSGATLASVQLRGDLGGGLVSDLAIDSVRGVIFATQDYEGRVFKLDLSTLAILDSIRIVFSDQAIALSPDGTRLFVAGIDGVEVFDPSTFARLLTLPAVGVSYDVAISVKGSALIVVRPIPGRVWVYDLATLALRFEAAAASPQRILIDPITHDGIILGGSGNLYRLRPR